MHMLKSLMSECAGWTIESTAREAGTRNESKSRKVYAHHENSVAVSLPSMQLSLSFSCTVCVDQCCTIVNVFLFRNEAETAGPSKKPKPEVSNRTIR